MFLNTAVVAQNETELDKTQQNSIIQKLTNLISTGDDNISFKKIIDKLNKKQLEEVGSLKTSERPINIVTEKLNKLEQQKNEIEEIKNKKYDLENRKKQLEQKQEEIENKIKIIKKIKINNENENIEKEIIQLNKKSQEEIKQKIEELKNNKTNKKIKNKKIFFIILFFVLLINILLFIFNLSPYLKYSIHGISIIYFLFFVFYILKNTQKNKKINLEKNKIKNQISLLEENEKNKENEIKELENKLKNKIENNINNLILEFGKSEVENIINNKINEINYYLEESENEYRNIVLQLQQLELEKKHIIPLLNEEANITEQIVELENEKNNLITLSNSIQIAKSTLEEAYDLMKNNLTPEFIKDLNNIVSKISNGKYNNIKFNDNDGIMVENNEGVYVPVYLLSIGTIDQIYFALRLSTLKQLTTQKIPIILDETFAYYDNERLKNILQYFNEYYKNNQIIILTCSNREKEILEELNIDYTYIKL